MATQVPYNFIGPLAPGETRAPAPVATPTVPSNPYNLANLVKPFASLAAPFSAIAGKPAVPNLPTPVTPKPIGPTLQPAPVGKIAGASTVNPSLSTLPSGMYYGPQAKDPMANPTDHGTPPLVLPSNFIGPLAPGETKAPAPAVVKPALPSLAVPNTTPQATPVTFPDNITTPSGLKVNPATGGVVDGTPGSGASLGTAGQGTPGAGVGYNSPEYKKAAQDYQDSLNMTPEEIANKQAQDDLQSSLALGKANTGNQPIPMEFITGQQKAEQDRALALNVPLAARAALLQAKRTASLDATKFGLDQADKVAQAQIDAHKPISVAPGSTLIDPTTGKTIYSTPAKPDTSVVDANGHKLLIDNTTGATIKDLGSSSSGSTAADDALVGSQIHTVNGNDSSGNPFNQPFINLTDFPDAASKKTALAYGAANGIPVLNPGEGEKMVSIDNAYTNIGKMADGLGGLLASTPGLNMAEGLWKGITNKFGDQAVRSFNAWRTAVINNVQALAGGSGSGLRINQAEIDTALKNDLPVVTGLGADTVGSAQAKLNRLAEQLDSWRSTLLDKGNAASTGSGSGDALDKALNSAGFKSGGSVPNNAQSFIGPVKLGSPLAIANNNPGNLKFAGQPGAVSGQGGFAKFSTPEAGVQALQNQIALDTSRGHTLSSFISKYAPPSENNTSQYLAQAVKSLGVTANTKLSAIDQSKLLKFMALKESSSQIG